MGFTTHAPASVDSHLKIGESFGWATLALSVIGGIRSLIAMFGAITPDQINPWLILIASSVTGLIAVGTLAYSRVIRAKLDGETLEAIYRANIAAINRGVAVPFPAFLPKGAMTIVTQTQSKTTITEKPADPERST